ncbi:MAG: hypothetical protein QI199_00795, partial [Candidatus Korarchaeota archaeon]|nr:hypothetical protein [Candidatus Korarchaeota archaeon]
RVYTVFIGRDPRGVRETKFIARTTGGKQYTASEIGDLVGILGEIANETNRIVANVTVKARVTVRREHRVHLAPPLYVSSLIIVAALSYLRYRASRLTI